VVSLKYFADDFNARIDAVSRTYNYFIHRNKNPFLNKFSWQYGLPLNLQKMNNAAALLKNYTDFECFSKVHTDVKTFNCRITQAQWEYITPHQLVFSITADRFLRNMVRAFVGTLLDVGKGKISVVIENDNNLVKILVTDTGNGIPKNQFKRIFEPGFTTKKRGWGLGLSLTKRIVEEYHKGKIKVLQSEIGKGTTMQVSFKKT
jgi:tRNA pseudouridine(38-40) synthase